MQFLSPLWLFALLPWVVLVLWVLRGRRIRVRVPFLQLWRGPAIQRPPERGMQIPPLAIIFLLLATFAAILAAARPAVMLPGLQGQATLIVDRGMTMSAQGRARPRFVETSLAAQSAIWQFLGLGAIRFALVPGTGWIHTDASDYMTFVEQARPTAMDTRDLLHATVQEALKRNNGPVLVLSDHDLGTESPRLIQIPPASPVENAGIVYLAARETPAPQAMLRVRNQSAMRKATLRVECDGQQRSRAIDLPQREQERDYFLDLPNVGEVVRATLEVKDDFEADNQAWLVRRKHFPVIEPHSHLPPELRRMIEVYGKARPAANGSLRVAVGTENDLAGIPGPAAIVAGASSATRASGPLRVRSHPLTEHVDWPVVMSDAIIAPPKGQDWMQLLTVADKIALAYRQEPTKAVWVGIESQSFPRRADFVVFWTNVFDWLGDGGQSLEAQPVTQLGQQWQAMQTAPGDGEPGLWPGLYRDNTGTLQAVNAPDVRFGSVVQGPWRDKLSQIKPERQVSLDLRRPLLLGALALILGAALCSTSLRASRFSG